MFDIHLIRQTDQRGREHPRLFLHQPNMSSRSDFVDFITPLRERLKYYDPSRPPIDQPKNDAADPARAVPQGFIDAMIVREAVFVKEQGVALVDELDDADPICFHWVAYASIPTKARNKANSPNLLPRDEKMETNKSASTKIPIGTIRLVPGPYKSPHPNGKWETDIHKNNELYVKLGRLAVIKEFRKAGIAKLLIDTALKFIREHPYDVQDREGNDSHKIDSLGLDFRGLVLVHSQTGAQKVWKRHGFETDDSMGTWIEECIEHVGMWRRVDVREARRKSTVLLPGHPA